LKTVVTRDVGDHIAHPAGQAVRCGGPLRGHAEVIGDGDAEALELGEAGVREVVQGVRTVDDAHLHPVAIGGAVTTRVTEVVRPVELHQTVGQVELVTPVGYEVEPLPVDGGRQAPDRDGTGRTAGSHDPAVGADGDVLHTRRA
jgi:hypothetical protein